MAPRRSNVSIVYDILTREGGLAPHQAYGVIGRLQQESGQRLDTTAHGDKKIPGGSRGIGQWNRERLQNLYGFGGDNWTSPATQARFMIREGQGPERRAWNQIKAAQSVEEAARGAMGYERPQGFTWKNPTAGHGWENTVKNARNLARQGAGGVTLNTNPNLPSRLDFANAGATYDPGTPTIDSGTSLSADGVSDTPTPEIEPQGWAAKLKQIFGDGKGEEGGEESSPASSIIEGLTGNKKEEEMRQSDDTSIQSILPAMEGADSARIQSAQSLMAQIMQKKRQRGLTLTGANPNAFI